MSNLKTVLDLSNHQVVCARNGVRISSMPAIQSEIIDMATLLSLEPEQVEKIESLMVMDARTIDLPESSEYEMLKPKLEQFKQAQQQLAKESVEKVKTIQQ